MTGSRTTPDDAQPSAREAGLPRRAGRANAKDPLSGTGEAKGRLRLADVAKTIWLTRPDLRDLLGGDRERFGWWLLLNGAAEYRALAELPPAVPPEALRELAPDALPSLRPPLTRFMRGVWETRPDLGAAFDLGTPAGQEGFVWWYFVHGAAELGLARFVTPEQRRVLDEPDPRAAGAGGLLPVTRLMAEVWSRRPDLRQRFDLRRQEDREGFLAWWFVRGAAERNLIALLSEEQEDVLRSRPVRAWRATLAEALVWLADETLQRRFPDLARPDYADWLRRGARDAFPLLKRLAERETPSCGGSPAVRRPAPELAAGVNLLGYARGQLGIGEDVRMAALAFRAAGIPVSIYDVEPGREVDQGETSAAAFVSDALPYRVNLFCMTGMETARLAAVAGRALFDGRRSLGYWPWELPDWPQDWHHAYDLVDEVWAASRYAADAYRRTSPKPVRHMPMAVTVDATEGLARADFALPENRFLFVFAFDFLSSLRRKNPLAAVRAFRTAFPRGDEPVGLVVKAMRAAPGDPAWEALRAAAAADRRIVVLAGTFGRARLLDLYRCCDCFVSLHRSEGFGRGIAEAMMLGKPVIVTAHSGNMDFTTPGTAALVDYRPRRLAPGDYPFGAGQVWAEPDAEHAAWWMRRLVDDQGLRDRLASSGRRLTSAAYAPAAVGAHYAAVLGGILAETAPPR